MRLSESTRDRLRQIFWVGMHTLIVGCLVVSYTNIILTIDGKTNLYTAMGVFTALLVVYVFGVLVTDRIARQFEEIAETVDSIQDSVENISDSLPEAERDDNY